MSSALLFPFFFSFLRVLGFLLVFRALRSHLRFSGTLILAFALGFFILPQNSFQLLPEGLGVLLRACLEVALGAGVGLPFALGLEVPAMVGRMLDATRGALSQEQFSSLLESRVSPLEYFCLLLGLLFVLKTGIYQFALKLLFSTSVQSLSSFWKVWFESILEFSGNVFTSAVLVAAPALILIFLFEFSTAMLSRILGRVNIFFEALPLKMLFGVLVFFLLVFLSLDTPSLPLQVPLSEALKLGSVLAPSSPSVPTWR